MYQGSQDIEYDTFPVKLSYKLLNDPTLVSKYGITTEQFEKFKKEWIEKHPTPERTRILEASKKVIVEALKLKRYACVLEMLLSYKGDVREIYEASGIRYSEDEDERTNWLLKEISKSEQKLKIFHAQKLKLEESLKSADNEKEFKISDINIAFASLERHGVSITDYESLPWGRYDAHTKLIEKEAATRRTQKNGR